VSVTKRWVVLVFVLLSGCVHDYKDVSGDPMKARIDELMRDYAGANPGASVLVLKDGEPRIRASYGLGDLEANVPVTPATNFRLASVSKQFTAAGILLLMEEEKLRLDDRLAQWLQSLPPATSEVTLRHLLTHTSGLIDYEDVMPSTQTTQLNDQDVLRLLESQDRTYFAPGTAYRYSNSGYVLLGPVIEKASGQAFPEFLQRRIFEPLEMRNTVAHVESRTVVPHRAYGYSFENNRWTRTDQSPTSATLGDGGIYSSIDDLARWDAALYDNRLLRPESLAAAFTPATPTEDPNVAYGFGWRITSETLWHSGESIGFRNVLVRYPQRRLTVVVLTNRNDPEPYRLALAIAELAK
jgi:CubicO group peptidase (beta-lactamase class C family)